MSVAEGCAEDWSVLQIADDAVEAAVALQGDVLGVFVADGAELATEVGVGNATTTQSTSGVSVRCHV
jgi:hypothetical protein